MNRLFRIAVPALIAALATQACTTPGSTVAVASPSLSVPPLSIDTMKAVTKELSSDAYEGRAPGTAGEQKSVAYIIAQYKAAGLEPGNNGSWTQDVPLVEITGSDFSPLVIAGGTKPLAFHYGDQYVAATYREQAKIAIKDSSVVFVGYGINAPEKGWNDYAGVDVKGKTVVILVNDPDYETKGLVGPFNGRAMTYYGRWTYKFEEAARQGAAAALIVHDTEPAAYGWNVVNSSWTGPQYYAKTSNGGADQTMANGWVQKDVAKAMLASAGQDLDALTAAAKIKGFKAVPTRLTASLSFTNRMAQTPSHNVIGVLPGTVRPDEHVLYTAHWDHLGRCTPDADGDDICNGAVDNANGVAALVTLAQAYKAAGAPQRSVVFLAVTAEESGLLGSQYYAEHPVFPLATTVGGVNMDALSMSGPARNIVVTGRGKSEIDRYVEAAAKAENVAVENEASPEKGHYYRSDHFSFAKLGVPMAAFESGEDLVTGGRAAGKAAADDYTEHRYHAPSDEYDDNWDWTGIDKDLRLYYRVGRMLADGNDWPNWVAGDEFRAIRDKSRAGR